MGASPSPAARIAASASSVWLPAVGDDWLCKLDLDQQCRGRLTTGGQTLRALEARPMRYGYSDSRSPRLRGLRISLDRGTPGRCAGRAGSQREWLACGPQFLPATKAGLDRHHDLIAVLDELVGADGDLIEHVQEGAPEISGGLAPAIDAHLDASG